MTFGQRFLLTLIIVIVILFALAAAGYFTGWNEDESARPGYGLASAESRPELCMDNDTRERVRKLMYDALDDALHDKVKSLMEVWLRDPTDQPSRAERGLRSALHAYVGARAGAAKFNPPECSG